MRSAKPDTGLRLGKTYRVGEETNAGDDNGTDMVPAKRRLVNLGQCQTTALVGVSDMCEVVVEVVESGVSARGLVVPGLRSGDVGLDVGLHARDFGRLNDTGHDVYSEPQKKRMARFNSLKIGDRIGGLGFLLGRIGSARGRETQSEGVWEGV